MKHHNDYQQNLKALFLCACSLALCLFGAPPARNPLLPDPKITPGATNPKVSQSNIKSTVCDDGWTKTIRPSASYTDKLKISQMKALGLKGAPADYEEDHLVSLEVGGNPTDPKNLWPQPWPEARKKDVVETALKRQVCAGKMPLAQAQKILKTDWTAYYFKLKGAKP